MIELWGELRAQAWKYVCLLLAVVALSAIAAAGVQTVRLGKAQLALSRAQTEAAQAAAFASEAARNQEHTRAEAVNHIADAYERGKRDAIAQGDKLAADLRAGNERLRDLWQGCKAPRVPGPAADPGEPDPADGLREASAGRVVGAVAACQAERDALLKIAEADRGKGPRE